MANGFRGDTEGQCANGAACGGIIIKRSSHRGNNSEVERRQDNKQRDGGTIKAPMGEKIKRNGNGLRRTNKEGKRRLGGQ